VVAKLNVNTTKVKAIRSIVGNNHNNNNNNNNNKLEEKEQE
jgi:hypothetical protein